MVDYIKGIDVSSVQGKTIDWTAVAASGVKFCIIKGYEGNKGLDAYCVQNIAGAKAAGILVGVYSFIYPLPVIPSQLTRDPKWQAQKHFAAAKGNLGLIDLEWPAPQDWAKWGCSASQICDWTLAYLQEYERLDGRKPLVYTYPYFAQALKMPAEFANYKLWIASYEAKPAIPAPWTSWEIWQNTGGGGKMPSGAPVDTDLVRDLSLWGIQTVQPTSTSTSSIITFSPTSIQPEVIPNNPDATAPSPARPSHPVDPTQPTIGWGAKLIAFVKSIFN